MKKILFWFLIIILISSNKLVSQNYTWNEILKSTGGFCDGIDNLDSLNLVVLMSPYAVFRVVLHSSDAGKNWNPILSDTIGSGDRYFGANDIAYPTKNDIFIVCRENVIVKTNDGGKNWDEIRINSEEYVHGLKRINMFDKNYGITSTTYKLFVTNDGFKNFDSVFLPYSCVIMGCFLTDKKTINCSAVQLNDTSGNDPKFFKSYDFGKTWIEYEFPNTITPRDIKFADSLNGYICGEYKINIGDQSSNLIYKTTDGGVTWKKVLSHIPPISFGIQYIDVLDKETAIALGQYGNIYWTHNGGKSWYYDDNKVVKSLQPPSQRICILDKTTAIIGDIHGRIFRSSAVEFFEEIPEDIAIVVYPNPVYNSFQLSFEIKLNANLVIEIYDIAGNKIATALNELRPIGTTEFNYDASKLQNGTYILKLQNGPWSESIKFVVNR